MTDKILFITTSYEQKNSSAAVRNNGLVKGLISLGCDVTVLTVEWPESVKSKYFIENNRATVIKTRLTELKSIGLFNNRSGKTYNQITSNIRHFIRDLMYFPDICGRWRRKVIKMDVSRYDYIISSSDFKSSHFVAQTLLRKNKNLKWLQIWGDPWSIDSSLSIVNKIRIRNTEKKILSAANGVVYVSSLTNNYMRNKFPDLQHKFHFIPRSYYEGIRKEPIKNKTHLDIIYPGVISFGRNIKYLLEAINEFNHKASIKFKLTLYGNYSHDIVKYLDEYDFVIVRPSVEYGEILNCFRFADVALFLSNDSSSTQIPGKLYDFFGTEIPVLCILNNGAISLANLLSQFKRCKISFNSKEKIYNALQEIASTCEESYPFESLYSPENIGKEILDLLRSL